MRRDSVLVVDDEEVNRLLLEEIFKNSYKVLTASNGAEALDMLKEYSQRIACVVLDLEMPVMNGYKLLEIVLKTPEAEGIPFVIATADETNEAQIRAFDFGVADVLRKPYHPKIVTKRVKNIVALYEYQQMLENQVEEQVFRLEEQERALAKINEELIDALSSVVEFRDLETGEHILRIKRYTAVMCHKMMELYPDCGLTEEMVSQIVSASSMHDIGKIAIPDAILLKPGRLTPEEFQIIQKHTTKGALLLDRVKLINNNEYLQYCRNICLYHHEKYDGKGYPRGLKGEEIPLEAQIVSIADVFDALVSKRIYKEAYSIETSFKMINEGECGQFSDRILSCFNASLEEFKSIAEESFKKELEEK